MNREILDYTVEKTHELINAPTCSAETKASAQSWLNAVGTTDEAAETVRYLAELEEDIVTVDGLIAFAESETGAQIFGGQAPQVAAHARDIKAAGARYCDCPACAAVEKILEKKESILS